MNVFQKMDRVKEILEFLNEKRIRCTYAAVAEVLGMRTQSVSLFLGRKRPEASWIVSKAKGTPPRYSENERHPDLFRTEKIIQSGHELMKAIDEWKLSRS